MNQAIRLFENLLQRIIGSPKRFLLLVLVICGAALISASNIQIKTSNLDLISESTPEVQKFLEFAERFGTPNVLVIVFQTSDPTVNKPLVIEKVGKQLRGLSEIQRVIDKAPLDLSKQLDGQHEYFQSKDGSAFFIFVQPKNTRTNVDIIAPLVSEIRSVVSKTIRPFGNIKVGYTGIPQYALDDQEIIQRDISVLSFLSLGLTVLIFSLGFSSLRGPFYATATLLISVLVTMGCITFFPGHLTLLSAPFVSIVFGLGVDYGIYIIHHLEELNHAKPDEYRQNVTRTIQQLSRSLLTECAATVAAFLVLTTSGFKGFAELGLISAFAMIACLICMLTILPALLVLFPLPAPKQTTRRFRVSQAVSVFRKLKIAPIILALSTIAFFSPNPPFDTNYLKLQPADSEAVALERFIIEESEYSPYFAAFTVDSLTEAASLTAKLRSNSIVGSVRSASDIPPFLFPMLSEEQRSFFFSKDGKIAVYAFPAKNIWIPEFETEFITAMRELHPSATGMPFIGNMMMQKTKEALSNTSRIALVVVLATIMIDFQSLLLTAIVILPSLLALLWMHFCMGIFGIPYNPLNIMALPIILGISVDNAIHITHRFLKEHGQIDTVLNGAGRGVMLTSITTLVGFGALSFASHLGLRSFSILLTIGVALSLFFSMVVLPWCLESTQRWTLRKNNSH